MGLDTSDAPQLQCNARLKIKPDAHVSAGLRASGGACTVKNAVGARDIDGIKDASLVSDPLHAYRDGRYALLYIDVNWSW